MNRSSFFITVVTLALFCCFTLTQVVFSGALDDFEGDVTKPRSEKSKDDNTGSSRDSKSIDKDNDPFGNCLGSCLSSGVEVLFNGIGQGLASMEMPQERNPGSPVLPYARVDMSWQDVKSDVEARSYMIQGGYMHLGGLFRHTRYAEDSPDDRLDFYQYYLLFRLAHKDVVEIDLGLGKNELSGSASNSGVSVTLPVLLYFSDNIGVEFRPAWGSINGNLISDYDISVSFGTRFACARFGFRSLESEHYSLPGPYAGVTISY